MSEVKIIGDAVKNMPWQEGPAEFSGAPVWRYGENPIIGRNPVKEVARIFNSAVMPYGDEFKRNPVHLPWKKQRCDPLEFR